MRIGVSARLSLFQSPVQVATMKISSLRRFVCYSEIHTGLHRDASNMLGIFFIIKSLMYISHKCVDIYNEHVEDKFI